MAIRNRWSRSRIWCNGAEYWGVKLDMTKAIKEALDGAGVNIPYPQRTVHLVKDD